MTGTSFKPLQNGAVLRSLLALLPGECGHCFKPLQNGAVLRSNLTTVLPDLNYNVSNPFKTGRYCVAFI